VYLTAQIALGVWVSRRIGTEADYLVAGRKLGYALTTFSMFATWFGAETVISGAGRAYERGFSLNSPEPFGYGLCLLLLGGIFAVPLWRRQLTTLADLFRQRYSVRVERLAAIILIPSSIFWAAAQIRAFGNVVATASPDLSLETALAVAAGFTIIYTMFGGLLADAMTDLVQGVVLIVGLLVVTVGVYVAVGGMDGVQLAISSAEQTRVLMPDDGNWLDITEAWAIPIIGSVVTTELVGRIVGTRSAAVARGSSLMAGAMYISIGLLPLFVGMVGMSLAPDLGDAEQLVPRVALQVLPTALYAIFAGGLVSAILSTVDSTLLVASGLLSHNLLIPVLRITSEQTKVRLARAGVFMFGTMAFGLALGAESVFSLIQESSSIGSAGTIVTVCFALFTTFGGPRAAAATLAVSVVVYLAASFGELQAPFLASLAASLATYPLVALTEQRHLVTA
jgi:Na+/proline symporter